MRGNCLLGTTLRFYVSNLLHSCVIVHTVLDIRPAFTSYLQEKVGQQEMTQVVGANGYLEALARVHHAPFRTWGHA